MNITELIKEELLKRVEECEKLTGTNHWEEHIKYVVKHAKDLAIEYGADIEIVELGALLHDINHPSMIGPIEEHHIYGAQIAEELLTQYNYPKDRIERVKQCVLNHSGLKEYPRNTLEEEIIADADVLAHFDSIPFLFKIAFKKRNLDLKEGTEFVKKKLENDYNKLSTRTREMIEDRYQNILKVLFVEDEE